MFYCNSTSSNKTLIILNDANMPNYLYNKIVDWAIEAQMSNIDFADMKKQGKDH